MADPVKVTVTGAAGQIGYAILFRIRQRSDDGRGCARPPEAARDTRTRSAPLRARRWNSRTAPSRCSPGSTSTTTPPTAFDGCQHRVADRSAPGATKAWSAPTCWRRTAASSSPRAWRSTSTSDDDVKVLVVGNPANTNCHDRAVTRTRRAAGAVHCDDAAGSQPGNQPSSRTSSVCR